MQPTRVSVRLPCSAFGCFELSHAARGFSRVLLQSGGTDRPLAFFESLITLPASKYTSNVIQAVLH